MEHLRRLGLAERLRRAAPIPVAYAQDVIFCTGLFGREITRFSGAFALTTETQEEFAETSQQAPQPLVEEILRTSAASLPSVELMIGSRVTSLRDDDAAVAAEIVDGQGLSAFITARYAIGADGAGGISRQAIGARYEGSSGVLPNLNITFRSRSLDPDRLCGRAIHYWIVGRTPAGIMGPLDLAGTWWTIVQGVADPASVDPVRLVHDLCGAPIDVEVLATDPWSARTLLVDRYAGRRIFLVGDAAHLNPPWGGHGFNTCVGDAVNLAWKIAAVLRGHAGARLLDSYEIERRPVARQTLNAAGAQEAFLAPAFATAGLDDDTDEGRRLRTGSRMPSAWRNIPSFTVSVSCSGTSIRCRPSSGVSMARRVQPRSRTSRRARILARDCRMPGWPNADRFMTCLAPNSRSSASASRLLRSWPQPLDAASR